MCIEYLFQIWWLYVKVMKENPECVAYGNVNYITYDINKIALKSVNIDLNFFRWTIVRGKK